MTVDHITFILNADPGTFVSSNGSCRYSSGLLLGITGASDWQAAADAITADARADSKGPIADLGEEAITATYGTTRVTLARQGDFVVAAQGALDQPQSVGLVRGMLDSLAALQAK